MLQMQKPGRTSGQQMISQTNINEDAIGDENMQDDLLDTKSNIS